MQSFTNYNDAVTARAVQGPVLDPEMEKGALVDKREKSR